MDTNGDGVVDRDEYERAQANARAATSLQPSAPMSLPERVSPFQRRSGGGASPDSLSTLSRGLSQLVSELETTAQEEMRKRGEVALLQEGLEQAMQEMDETRAQCRVQLNQKDEVIQGLREQLRVADQQIAANKDFEEQMIASIMDAQNDVQQMQNELVERFPIFNTLL